MRKAVILAALVLATAAHAQQPLPPTRTSAYDWQCRDALGEKLKDYDGQQAAAYVDCFNTPGGVQLVGGTYQVQRVIPNTAPTISGTPPAAVEVGEEYSFTPTAIDAEGDTLGFSIENRPQWASFDPATGTLSGTPGASWVGVHSSIKITVSDGKLSTSTTAFSITVTPPPPPPALTAPAIVVPLSYVANTANPDRFNVPLSWNAIEGATAYEVRRCTGVNCTGFTLIKTVTTTSYTNTNIPGGITYKYRVRAMRGTEAGPTSANAEVAIPPVTPAPPVLGSSSLEWQAPTQNTNGSALTNLAGFRVVYGTTAAALTQTIDIPNPAARTYKVDGLSSGTWYFAVRAYNSAGGESVNSNVASKVIP